MLGGRLSRVNIKSFGILAVYTVVLYISDMMIGMQCEFMTCQAWHDRCVCISSVMDEGFQHMQSYLTARTW